MATLEELRQMKKKYSVTSTGTKKEIVTGLWRENAPTVI
jgi:hypothetical protein